MHHIQKKIIESLTLAPSRRYSEMRPKRVESNQFAYHLKELLKDGLIEKTKGAYTLSPKGMAYIDKVSYATFKTRAQPKIVTLLDITSSEGETILLRRLHQPYYGKVLFPTGKVHMGETMLCAAQREADEKLGLQNLDLEHRGVVMVAVKENGELISQVLAHVFQTCTPKTRLKKNYDRINCFWAKPHDVDRSEYLDGFFEIKKLLTDKKSFFYEEFWFEI